MARGNGGNAGNAGNAGGSGSSSNSSLEDNSSPYYLHPSDNPNLQLVPQVLTGSNYINWSRSITTALLAKNKLPFVNGTLLRPDDDHLLLPVWIRCNSMVVSWLRNSISPQICSSIMYLENAYEIWLDLRDRFSQSDSARSYQLRQQIMNLTQGQNDVNSYFTNLRIVWDEFKHFQPIAWCTCSTCRCNSARRWQASQEDDCTMQFLIGLNPSFSQIRSTILSMVPLPSLSKVFSMVVQEERQRNIDNTYVSPSHSSSEQLFAANAASSSYGRGRLCTQCGKTNHTIDRCFVLHGFPPSFGRGRGKPMVKDSMQPKSVNLVEDNITDYSDKQFTNTAANSSVTAGSIHSTMEQCQQLMALLQSQLGMSSSPQPTSAPPENISAALIHSSTASPQIPSSQPSHFAGTFSFTPFVANIAAPNSWLIDTGATHHVCCNLSMFDSSSPVSETFVNLPNGETVTVTHIGTIHLTSSITLVSVLFVPSFTFNLISVSSLTSSLPCVVNFTHDSLTIQETSQGTLIGKGKRVGNLYTLIIDTGIVPSVSISVVNAIVSVDTWHMRLGHPSINKLKCISDALHLPNKTLSVCDICPMAKQKHLSFTSSNSIADNPFDLLHCDVWGPFNPCTSQGFTYFLTIVDNASRFVWTFLM